MIKSYLTWPWIVSVPLLLGGFGCSVFFVGTDSPLLAPAVLALLAYVAITLYPNFKTGWALPKTNSFIFVMLFWLWLILSMFWSTVPYVSTTFTIILSILPAFFIVSILAPKAEDWVKVHAFALWLALGSFAVWAVTQFFFLFDEYGPRIHHPMLNPNNLAGLFNLGIFPAMGLFFLSKSKPYVVLLGLVVVIFYAALIVTQSRGALLSFAICAAMFLPFAVFKTRDYIPWNKLAFIAAIAFLVPFLSNIYHEGSLEKNLVGATLIASDSVEDRFLLWQSTWHMIKDHFWLGTGLASFFFYYPRYRMPLDSSDGFFAHMDPLQFWAEMGVMAPVFFYGVLICVLFRTIRAVLSAGPDLRKRLEVTAPFFGMLALLGHTHITFHLYMPGMLLPLSALLAYWYMATERALDDAGKRVLFNLTGKMKMVTIGGFALILIITGGWTARISAATHLMGQVKQETQKNNKEVALKTLKLAGLVAPGSFGRYYEYEARFRVSMLWESAKSMDKAEVRKIYDEALYYLDEAEKRNPVFTTIWDLRARLHFAVNGIIIENGQELAIDILLNVIEANPMSADARVGLANVYKVRGELSKAAKVLEDGVHWPRAKGRTDIVFLITLASLKMQLGDRQAHDRYMAEAQRRAQIYGMVVK